MWIETDKMSVDARTMVIVAGARVIHGLASRVEKKAAEDGEQPGKFLHEKNASEDEDGAEHNCSKDAPGQHL
jgi:hypothetical protein